MRKDELTDVSGETARLIFPALSQRNVSAASMLTGKRPGCFTMANEKQLQRFCHRIGTQFAGLETPPTILPPDRVGKRGMPSTTTGVDKLFAAGAETVALTRTEWEAI